MIPGSNLLSSALKIIAPQDVYYHRNVGRVTNEIGMDIADYAPVQTVRGQVQPIPAAKFALYGLDFTKNYVTLHIEKNAIDLTRDYSGDKIVYACKTYQLQGKTDWFAQDGWVKIICVEVPC